MMQTGKPLSELARAAMERVPQVLENVTLPARRPLEEMAKLAAATAKVKKELGDEGRVLDPLERHGAEAADHARGAGRGPHRDLGARPDRSRARRHPRLSVKGKPMAAARPTLDAGLLVLRLAGIGLAVFHGWPKLGALLAGTSRFHEGVGKMGLPFPVASAWAAALGETVGGLLVALGFFTRIAAVALRVTMVVAAFLRHHAHHYLLASSGSPRSRRSTLKTWGNPELALMYLGLASLVALAGPAPALVALDLDGAGRASSESRPQAASAELCFERAAWGVARSAQGGDSLAAPP